MNLPSDLKYSKDHAWIRVEAGSIGIVGITHVGQSELGEVVKVDVDTVGHSLSQADEFGDLESVKAISELIMPISGKVLEINSALSAQPGLVNSDPYGQGWLIKVELSDTSELDSLLDAAAYSALIEREYRD